MQWRYLARTASDAQQVHRIIQGDMWPFPQLGRGQQRWKLGIFEAVWRNCCSCPRFGPGARDFRDQFFFPFRMWPRVYYEHIHANPALYRFGICDLWLSVHTCTKQMVFNSLCSVIACCWLKTGRSFGRVWWLWWTKPQQFVVCWLKAWAARIAPLLYDGIAVWFRNAFWFPCSAGSGAFGAAARTAPSSPAVREKGVQSN